MGRYKIGVVGLEHDHVWDVVPGFLADERSEVVAVADANPPLVAQAKEKWDVEQGFGCWREMLDRIPMDAVIVYGDNAMGVDVVEAAASKGLHAMVEKPMAATLRQADRMLIAAEKAGITLMINWPTAWNPNFATAVDMATASEIGEVFKVRYRAAHEGPQEYGCTPYFCEWLFDKDRNGGGALIDYCCYGAAYAAHLLGRPNAATAIAGRLMREYITVEDNAVILAKYDKGLAICEASWTTYGFGYELMINGSRGTLRSDGRSVQIARNSSEAPQTVETRPLPDDRRNAASHFLTCIDEKRAPEGMCNPVVSRNAQEILEAGIIASETGSTVPFPVVSRR
ncbi:MAG: Gfo/Idh/MocA family protein [Limnochordia bacterium]|jgi:predicted dehydrogenase